MRTPTLRTTFHRRLVLLAGVTALAYAALGAQLGRLTLVKGEELRARAESRLVRRGWTPTVRGRILDRKGRVLAHDRPGYEARLEFEVLTGAWADRAAARLARQGYRSVWRTMDEAQRGAVTEAYARACREHQREAWDRLGEALGVGTEELRARAGEVVAEVGRMKESVERRARERLIAEQRERGAALDDAALERIDAIAARPIAEEQSAHEIASGVEDLVGFELARLAGLRTVIEPVGVIPPDQTEPVEVIPGLVVRNAADRAYPFDEVQVELDLSTLPRPVARAERTAVTVHALAASVIGRVRPGFFAEDVERRAARLDADPAFGARVTLAGVDRGAYQPGDAVGHTGVEASREDDLRGLRGVRTENLSTGQVETVAPTAGRDVRLTLDVALQARVRAAMDPSIGLARVQPWHHNETVPVGTHLYGAAVVLEIQTGDVLAMVSTPAPPREDDWSHYALETPEQIGLFTSLFTPEINRAIAKPYPPGSIAKAMVLTGAIDAGVYAPGERIPATGHLLPDRPDVFRSWIYKMYGITHRDQLGRDPDAVDALMVSANVFFYTLGRRLGTQRIAAWFARFGVGRPFGLGLGPEWPGRIGSVDGPGDGSDLEEWDAILIGIGQGPITWTPLHAANAYATLARDGVVLAPRVVQDGSAPVVLDDLRLAPDALHAVLEGLRLAVADERYGTGCSIAYDDGQARERIFRVGGVTVWGKTGTATAPDLVVDPDGPDGPSAPVRALSGDHSWFVVLVGEEGGDPRYAIAVVMDYAGSGGRVSGPITDQIIRALVDEGYLSPGGTP